jgi:hypothetical protein
MVPSSEYVPPVELVAPPPSSVLQVNSYVPPDCACVLVAFAMNNVNTTSASKIKIGLRFIFQLSRNQVSARNLVS